MNKITSYPLQWPLGYKRNDFRKDSPFRQTPGKVQDLLLVKLKRLGASNIVISSNAQRKANGEMYADAMMRQYDPGVAVYFDYNKKPVVLCCDTYVTIWENAYAIAKTIENLRAIERYGVSDFLSRSFTGFAELPASITPPYHKPWYEVLGLSANANAHKIKEAYRNLVMQHHPDRGGDPDKFKEIKSAYEQGLSLLK